MPKKKIAILFHGKENPANVKDYLITYYAQIWVDRGDEVIFIFGTERYVPADLIIVHVDLSVVPEEYLQFAAEYPMAINGKVKDIRKSIISPNLVTGASAYQGKVIVKSDFNYAGLPETRLCPEYAHSAARLFRSPHGYQVFNSYSAIPNELLKTDGIVVEKFMPECEHGLYHVRFYNFLGSRGNSMRLASRRPVVHINEAVAIEAIPVDPRLDDLRKKLNFDYGKFDYVVIDGEIILFDTNKTTGFIGKTDDPKIREMRWQRAMGIYDYF